MLLNFPAISDWLLIHVKQISDEMMLEFCEMYLISPKLGPVSDALKGRCTCLYMSKQNLFI